MIIGASVRQTLYPSVSPEAARDPGTVQPSGLVMFVFGARYVLLDD